MVSTGVYKSCYKIELQQGSKTIGVLGLIGSFGNIFMLLVLWGDGRGRDFSKAFKDYFNADVSESAASNSLNALLVIAMLLNLTWFVCDCLMLHGIRKKKPEFLKTWLLAHIPAFVVSVKVGYFLVNNLR